MQRVILAREISEGPGLMIAMQPTRGLDVGAIEGVQRMLLELRRAGTAVLLVSEELDEIVCLSDRVAVIYEGQIVGEIPGDQVRCRARPDRTDDDRAIQGQHSPARAG